MMVGAINIFCRNCQSKPGQKCTRPTDDGRVNVSWYHLAREADAILENSRQQSAQKK